MPVVHAIPSPLLPFRSEETHTCLRRSKCNEYTHLHAAPRDRLGRRWIARSAHRSWRRRRHRPASHPGVRRGLPICGRGFAGRGDRHVVRVRGGLRAGGLHQHPDRHAARGCDHCRRAARRLPRRPHFDAVLSVDPRSRAALLGVRRRRRPQPEHVVAVRDPIAADSDSTGLIPASEGEKEYHVQRVPVGFA